MTSLKKIQQLKNDVYSDNHKTAMAASDELVKIGGQDIVDFFISLLDQDNSKLRDIAALGLHDISDNSTLESLLVAIKNPNNKNSNGTMAFALESLDCSEKLTEIFDLLFYGDAEVKMAATSILEDQDFHFTMADLNGIQAKWDGIKRQTEKSPYFQEYRDTMEYFVKMYLDGKKQSIA